MINLEESLIRDGAKLVNLTGNICQFTCKCGTNHCKPLKAILTTSGAFCKDCTQTNTSIKKIKNKIALNEALLAKQ